MGHDFKAGKWTFGPEASLGFTQVWIDGFSESGSLGPLDIEDMDGQSLRSSLGWKVSYDWELKPFTLRPYARLGWQHEFLDESQSVSARFSGGGGSLFTVEGAEAQRDSVTAGAGAQVLFNETLSLWLGYAAEASSDVEIHSVNGSFHFRF